MIIYYRKIFFEFPYNNMEEYYKRNGEIINIDHCCSEMIDLFGTYPDNIMNLILQKEDDDIYIEYIDYQVEWGLEYKIKFRYCPFCGEKIIFKGE